MKFFSSARRNGLRFWVISDAAAGVGYPNLVGVIGLQGGGVPIFCSRFTEQFDINRRVRILVVQDGEGFVGVG